MQAALIREIEKTDDSSLPLEVGDAGHKGRGIFAKEPYKHGDFVVTYPGDLISDEEAARRNKMYAKDDSIGSYMYYFQWKGKDLCIDATTDTGRLGRLINHSRKAPNLTMKRVEHNDRPHLVLYALKDIQPGEELTYDYNDTSKKALEEFPWMRE